MGRQAILLGKERAPERGGGRKKEKKVFRCWLGAPPAEWDPGPELKYILLGGRQAILLGKERAPGRGGGRRKERKKKKVFRCWLEVPPSERDPGPELKYILLGGRQAILLGKERAPGRGGERKKKKSFQVLV